MARKQKTVQTPAEEIVQLNTEAQPEVVAEQVQPEAPLALPIVQTDTQPVVEAKPEVTPVSVDRGEKITGITKANYRANLDRATELKAMLRQHLADTGGFPSHNYVKKTWGFNISLKAIIRHKDKILEAAGIDKATVKTTESLPRSKKAKAEVVVEAPAQLEVKA